MLKMSPDYALWLIPADDELEHFNRLIQRLATARTDSPTFTSHITLLHPIPITTPLSDLLTSLRDVITKVSQHHSLHNLSLSILPAQGGNHYYQSVFAPVHPHPALSALREACAQAFGIDAPKYSPHLSLLYGDLTGEERKGIAHRVNAQRDDLLQRISVRGIALVKVQGLVEDWVEIASITI